MTQEVKIIHNDDLDISDWSNLLSISNRASYFQSPQGYRLLKSYGQWDVGVIGGAVGNKLGAVLVFAVQKERGIKAIFSKRCIIFSGPVYNDQNVLREVLGALDRKLNGCVYFEIRNGYDTAEVKGLYQELGWKYIPWLNFIVSTSDYQSMYKGISESRRRQLKKAEKNGVILSNPRDLKDVQDFYDLLSNLYHQKIKKPLPEFEMFELFFNSDSRNFVLVYFEDRVIGGILAPFVEGMGSYEFYITGLDQEYKDCYPSAMATFGAMKQASEMGLGFFDFMGGGSPDEGYGVREFKARFGGQEVEWGRWLLVRKPLIYGLGKLYIKLRSK